VFENELLPALGIPEGAFHHEHMSSRILDHMVEANHLELATWDLIEGDLGRVKALMTGARPGPREDKKFLYDIVANKRNGIDVDKFDYLARDSYYSGVTLSCDTSRLMEFCKARGGV